MDPNLREKLLKESKQPFLGLRRVVWIALFGSAGLGLLIMFSRALAGDTISTSDLAIQSIALVVFAFLIWKDRSKD